MDYFKVFFRKNIFFLLLNSNIVINIQEYSSFITKDDTFFIKMYSTFNNKYSTFMNVPT